VNWLLVQVEVKVLFWCVDDDDDVEEYE